MEESDDLNEPRIPYSLLGAMVALVFFCCACASGGPNVYVRPGSPFPGYKKFAVFPFFNHTLVEEAGDVVTGAIIAELVRTGRFQMEFPGNVKSFLVEERIIVRTGVDLETIRAMGKILGVDAIVLGQIDEYVRSEGGSSDIVPVVSMGARIIDARSGKILFMAQHRRTGDDFVKVLDFGRIRSVGELTDRMAGEIVDAIP